MGSSIIFIALLIVSFQHFSQYPSAFIWKKIKPHQG